MDEIRSVANTINARRSTVGVLYHDYVQDDAMDARVGDVLHLTWAIGAAEKSYRDTSAFRSLAIDSELIDRLFSGVDVVLRMDDGVTMYLCYMYISPHVVTIAPAGRRMVRPLSQVLAGRRQVSE